MKTFLEHVAKDILLKYKNQIGQIAVVFPNKRAALFMNQALTQQTADPIWAPHYLTISELFRQQTTLLEADPIKLVSELHKSYMAITGKQETLDEFYSWGQMLLSDFDDIDKHMADVEKLFLNLRDIHEYDDLSYLTDEQKNAIKKFFQHFNDSETLIKQRFLNIWSRLYDIYTDYRERLISQGLAYEGMLYRMVIEENKFYFPQTRYLFVGFNFLHEVEQELFMVIKNEGKAAFYWDFDFYYLNPKAFSHHHEAGIYISKYLDRFPNELDNTDHSIFSHLVDHDKNITLISAATENIQARFVSNWLSQNNRIADGNRTAIVLCNEALLQSVTHSMPQEVKQVNITTGYPLNLTPIASFVSQVISLYYNGYSSRQNAFKLHFANAVLRHPYLIYICPTVQETITRLNTEKIYYISNETFCDDELLAELFSYPNSNLQLLSKLKLLVKTIAHNGYSSNDDLFQESTFRMYTLLNRLHTLIETEDIVVDKITLQRFIRQIIKSTSIPFHGEPAVGTQIMGVLETRNLDFDHLLILSCNEGNMPKVANDTSFIPYALRKAYGLTTTDNKVGIYSYYFHRMLQRASDVTVLYCNATDISQVGEMSRFMLQLLVESPLHINRVTLKAGQEITHTDAATIRKTPQVMTVLSSYSKLSPTAINKYIRCQKQFYYNYVLQIAEPDDTDEDLIDNRIFGNIFHRAAQLIYDTLLPHDEIKTADIERLLKSKTSLNNVIDQAFSEELFHLPEGTTRHPVLNGLQLINREVIETYLRQLLRVDLTLTPFRVIGHEIPIFLSRTINGREISIGGRIDRLDMTTSNGGALRVVDYKTGNKTSKDLKDISHVFDPKYISTIHSDYILQALLYSSNLAGILRNEDSAKGDNNVLKGIGQLPVSPALLFIQHAGVKDYSPVLTFCGTPITDIQQQCRSEFEELLVNKVEEIFSEETPFEPTANLHTCSYCPYLALCGRKV